MKILLMTPTITDEEKRPNIIGLSKNKLWTKFRDKFGFAPGITPSYGLLYISASLKQAGHKTFYIDGNMYKIDTILECIKKEDIKVVGVSVLSFNWERAKHNIKQIKSLFPYITIVVGGINATYLKQACLEQSKAIDIVAYGEGEKSIVELINRISENKTIDDLPGIIFRKNNKIIINKPYPTNMDLDKLPFPDIDVLANDMYKFRPAPMFYKGLPHASIFASRGCPFKCSFCLSSPILRKRDPYKVVDEIEWYVKKYGIKSLTFYDETLTLNKKWLQIICSEIIRRKIKIAWSANVRADCLNKEIIKIMRDSGCWQTLFGIETGVQKNLDKIAKGISLSQIEDSVNLVHENKVETLGMFMFGIPGETYYEGVQTIDFACKLPLDYAIFTNITPFPGTQLYEEVKNERGFKNKENLTPLQINYIPSSMTEQELVRLLKLSYRRFYFRRKFIFKQISKIHNLEDLSKNIKGMIQLWS